jgi:hypothetical protein
MDEAQGPCSAREAGRVAAGLLVHEVVDVTLLVERDRLPAVARDGLEAHGPEQAVQLLRLRMGVLDEPETVRAGGVLRGDLGGRGVVRKGTHLSVSQLAWRGGGPVRGEANLRFRREDKKR